MPRLQTQILYGLRTDVIGNAYFLNEDEIVYLVGNTIAVHNYPQQRQRRNRLPEKHVINFMTIAPNKKYAALSEIGEKPIISIYDLQSLKRKKLFGVPSDSSAVSSFMALSFTYDSKYIAALTNETQTMLFYNLEKGKLETSLDVGNYQNPDSKMSLITCNPNDSAIIALGGLYAFKFITLSENIWRPYGFTKADTFSIISICWLNGDRLLAGTMDGRMLFLENGDLKNVYKIAEVTSLNLKIKEEYIIQNVAPDPNAEDSNKENEEITSIISFHKGFAFSLGLGMIVVFEKDGQFKYTKRNVYMVPAKVLNDADKSLYRVNVINASPAADKLIITTKWSQIFYVKLWGPEFTEQTGPEYIEMLGHNLHHGHIGGLSTCSWKTNFLTFGLTDRSVRIWDYDTLNLIMIKRYLQDISCVVMHPSGLFCLIGFSDKLRFMSILIEDFLTIKEINIRSCKMASFSYGGHLFAAVNANIIQVISAMDFDVRFVLKGHIEVIQGMSWSLNDQKLVSIGLEGAIYQWDMSNGSRLSEIVLKGVTLYGVALSSDGNFIYCISSENKIFEIKENVIIHTYTIPGIQPKNIIMGKNDALIFITYDGGFLASLKYPFQDPIQYSEYHVHNSNITQINLTFDEQMLITTGDDGSMCLWKISYAEGKIAALGRDFLNLDQILIGRDNLAEKVQIIKDLNTRLKELDAEYTYKAYQTTLQHKDKIVEIHRSYYEAIEDLREKIDKLEHDHTNEINNINVDINNTKKEHEESIRQMEISYDAKLIVEYDKFNSIEERYTTMTKEYELKLEALAIEGKNALDKSIEKYEALLQEKDFQLQESHEELSQKVRIHEYIKLQIEDDTDREIVDLRTSYETKLHDERVLVLKLKGEVGVLRNKQKLCQKEVEALKWQLGNLREEYSQLMTRKEELEKQVMDLKDELADKQITISDKNKHINDLDRENRELEKYKFVLNERICELRSEIEPRDKEIAELKEKVNDMETELLSLNKTRQTLEMHHSETKGKLQALKKELDKEDQRRKRNQQLLRKIRVDLLEAVGLIKEPDALKNCVIKLYRRYSDFEVFLRNYRADMDAQCEFMKQRSHLENTIALLKKQLKLTNPSADAHLEKVLEENIMLLTELNSLREELSSAQRHIADMESLLGVRVRNISPMEARLKLSKVFHANEELEKAYKCQLEECQRVIDHLKEDIQRLMRKNTYRQT